LHQDVFELNEALKITRGRKYKKAGGLTLFFIVHCHFVNGHCRNGFGCTEKAPHQLRFSMEMEFLWFSKLIINQARKPDCFKLRKKQSVDN
jgi:hypothetical protein